MAEVRGTERFTKAPVALIDLMQAGVIKPTSYALWHVLWSFSDSERRECFPARETLANRLGLAKAASVDKYLDELVEAGLVVKFGRGGGGKQSSNGYRLVAKVSPNGDSGGNDVCAGGEQSPNGDSTITPGQQQSPNGDSSSPQMGIAAVPKTGHEQEPLNNNQLTRTNISPNRSGSERMADEKKSSDEEITPMAIPTDWVPNEQHAARMDELNFSDELMAGTVTAFYQRFDDPEILSTDWDKKFGWWINAVNRNPEIVAWTENMIA